MLASTYGFTPDYVREQLTLPQVRMFKDKARLHAYRQSYGLARVAAFLGNTFGGRNTHDDETDREPAKPIDPFLPEDFIPWFAWYEHEGGVTLEDLQARASGGAAGGGQRLDPRAARAFFDATDRGWIPAWALNISDVALWKRIAGET